MSRKSRYPQILKEFVVLERGKGTEWLEIQRMVQDVFKTMPPSIRQMRNWTQKQTATHIQSRLKRPEHSSVELNYVKRPELISPLLNMLYNDQSYKSMLYNLLARSNILPKGPSIRDTDPTVRLILEILASIERAIGREKYEEILERYRLVREQNKYGPPGPPQGNPKV
jgi:hypothetical protein